MEDSSCCGTAEPKSPEFISALAAGINAKLMVEVTSEVSPSTIALAAAASQTGGKAVCILPEQKPTKSQRVIEESGLKENIEFKIGDPVKVLPSYKKIDFSLVDCGSVDNLKVLQTLDVNPERSMVVADNLVDEKVGMGKHLKGMENKCVVRSTKHPIGKGMEITMIRKGNECRKGGVARNNKRKWIVEVDSESGEEHIYRESQEQALLKLQVMIRPDSGSLGLGKCYSSSQNCTNVSIWLETQEITSIGEWLNIIPFYIRHRMNFGAYLVK